MAVWTFNLWEQLSAFFQDHHHNTGSWNGSQETWREPTVKPAPPSLLSVQGPGTVGNPSESPLCDVTLVSLQ